MKRLTIILLAIIACIVSGCGMTEEANDEGKPLVFASFYPVYDLVDTVAGDTVKLEAFMPLDKDPHLWEPTPRDMKRLSEADLLVVNGANLEKWLDQVEDALPDLPILKLSESVDLITYKGAAAIGDFQYMSKLNLKAKEPYEISFGHTHENMMRIAFIKYNGEKEKELIAKAKEVMEDKGKVIEQGETVSVKEGQVYAIEMGHESGEIYYEVPDDGEWLFVSDRVSENILTYDLIDLSGNDLDQEAILSGSTSSLDKVTYDPHSWMSIVNGKRYLVSIYDDLSERYPENAKLYRKNRLWAIDELTDLEYEYKEKFKNVDIREFVTVHNAYGYIARDFDLVQFPLQELVSTESPSLKVIRTALNFCKQYKIKIIFYEYGMDSKNADSLAEELGGQAVPLISMEYAVDVKQLEDTSYEEIMRDNLEKIYQALIEPSKEGESDANN